MKKKAKSVRYVVIHMVRKTKFLIYFFKKNLDKYRNICYAILYRPIHIGKIINKLGMIV